MPILNWWSSSSRTVWQVRRHDGPGGAGAVCAQTAWLEEIRWSEEEVLQEQGAQLRQWTVWGAVATSECDSGGCQGCKDFTSFHPTPSPTQWIKPAVFLRMGGPDDVPSTGLSSRPQCFFLPLFSPHNHPLLLLAVSGSVLYLLCCWDIHNCIITHFVVCSSE